MDRLLLHLGYPKTGTTALQSEVFPRLAGDDLGYLGIAAEGAIRTDNRYLRWRRQATGLTAPLIRTPVRLEDLAQCRHVIGSPTRALLISEEVLTTEPMHAALVGRRDPGRGLSRTLERLRVMVPDRVELSVLLTIRRQEDLLPAFVAQEAHRVPRARMRSLDHAMRRLRDYGSPLQTLLSFDVMTRRIIDILRPHSLAILPVELLSTDPSSFMKMLATAMGLASAGPAPAVRYSRRADGGEWVTSYGPVSSLVHRAYAALPLPLPPEWMKRRSQFSATPTPRRPPPVIHRSEADRLEIRSLFTDSNDRLSRRTGLDLATLGYALPAVQ